MKIKLLAILPICLICCACAITTVGKYNHLLAKITASENWNDNFHAEMKCPEEMVSMAISPLIPLPPIIPMGFFNEDISKILVRSPHGYKVTPKILNSDGQEVAFSITEVMRWTGNEYGLAEYVSWAFDVNSICEKLESHMLQIEAESPDGKKSTARYMLKYLPGDTTMEVGYLGA